MEVGGGRSRSRSRGILFGAFVFFSVFLFVFVTTPVNRKVLTGIVIPSSGIFKHVKLIGRKRHAGYGHSKLVYVSKRRVPNGPDPIHNRRAVKTKQPPGQA